MPAGRPSEYNYELCKAICEHVANGMGIIKSLEQSDDYPSWTTFRRWKSDNAELQTLYACAREDRSNANEDRIDGILEKIETGEIDPASARVLIDTIKWKMAKENPKVYGDSSKLDVTSGGDKIDNRIVIEHVDMSKPENE